MLCAALTFSLFYACDNEEEPDFTNYGKEYVKISGVIEGTQTKASFTNWEPGDGIGVYMKTAGGSLSTDHLADNVKYTTPGDGIFAAAIAGIQFPATGSVDFIAYYPYQAAHTGYTLAFSVANQSSLPDIDVLYSNNVVSSNKANPSVAMNFRHKLSQLTLNVTAGDGVTSFSGLALSMANAKVAGTLDLEDGTVASTGDASTLTLLPVVNGTTATVQAILMPGQDLKDTPLTFTVGGKTFEWIPTTQPLESGKKYTYSIQLTATGVVVLTPNGTIEDWVDGNPGGGSAVLTPKENDFQASATTVALDAAAGSNDAIQLTAPSDQPWTAVAADSWLTVAPADGTGSESITFTAEANPDATERITTVTITPTGSSSLTAITVTVTQAGNGATGATLLFPGSDFEDWGAFTGALNSYGLISSGYAAQSATGGRNGSSALYLNGTPSGNDYVFTVLAGNGRPASGSRIVFYIKGTSAKSLSLNIYSGDGVASGYYKFNVGNYTDDMVISSSTTNSYTGTINTGGQWAKITLDISGIPLNTLSTDSYFALKVGKDEVYNLYVDDITIE